MSLSAPLALAVKITSYSSADALKNCLTASRASSTSRVAAAELGLCEWGLPNTRSLSSAWWRASCDSAYCPPPV